ncbi:hypothetical protein SRO_6296 [Streptomyces rochei]|nr:hypothetical protein SRO_6296 [Streptomyces rochei]
MTQRSASAPTGTRNRAAPPITTGAYPRPGLIDSAFLQPWTRCYRAVTPGTRTGIREAVPTGTETGLDPTATAAPGAAAAHPSKTLRQGGDLADSFPLTVCQCEEVRPMTEVSVWVLPSPSRSSG